MSKPRATTQLKPFDGFLYSDGSANPVGIKCNFTAVVAPTINDDSGDGYAVGSRWVDTLTNIGYECADASVGAAVWNSGSGNVTNVFGRTGAVTATSGDYTASQITNVASGGIVAVNVQTAINELDTEKADKTTTITGTNGVTGGGSLAANRTLSLDITGLTGVTNPITTWTIPIYDGANKKITLAEMFRVINNFTSAASLAVDDFFAFYQTGTGTVKKISKSDLQSQVGGGGGGGGAVDSVFGRTGSVVAVVGDYEASEVSYVNTLRDGVVCAVVSDALDSYDIHKADLDGNLRLWPAEFPSNGAWIRYARAAQLSATSTNQAYSATGGSSGRGQITNAPLQIDGVTLSTGDRVLNLVGIGSPPDLEANGLWEVTVPGSGGNGTWERCTDMDNETKVQPGTLFYVEEGTIMHDSLWMLLGAPSMVVGGASGDNLMFYQIPTVAALPQSTSVSPIVPVAAPIQSAIGLTYRYSLRNPAGSNVHNIGFAEDQAIPIMFAPGEPGTAIFQRIDGVWRPVPAAGVGTTTVGSTPAISVATPAGNSALAVYVPGTTTNHNKIWLFNNTNNTVRLITPSGTFSYSDVAVSGGGAAAYQDGDVGFYSVEADLLFYINNAQDTLYKVNPVTNAVTGSTTSFTGTIKACWPRVVSGVLTHVFVAASNGDIWVINPTTMGKTLAINQDIDANTGMYIESQDVFLIAGAGTNQMACHNGSSGYAQLWQSSSIVTGNGQICYDYVHRLIYRGLNLGVCVRDLYTGQLMEDSNVGHVSGNHFSSNIFICMSHIFRELCMYSGEDRICIAY